jgi:AcrR family transcriptional regulator
MARRRRDPTATRTALIEASVAVLKEHGITGFTLDRVAAIAGVSKGGLLYHYPNKEALLQATVARFAAGFTETLEAVRASDEDVVAAYVEASFVSLQWSAETQAVMSISAVDDALVDPMRAAYAAWQQALANDPRVPWETAMLLRMAVDGMWFAQTMRMAPLSEPELTRFQAHLRALTHRDT